MADQYQRKPLRVEAMQYTSETCKALHAWLDFDHNAEGVCGKSSVILSDPNGWCEAYPGNWIVRHASGALEVLDESTFHAEYGSIPAPDGARATGRVAERSTIPGAAYGRSAWSTTPSAARCARGRCSSWRARDAPAP